MMYIPIGMYDLVSIITRYSGDYHYHSQGRRKNPQKTSERNGKGVIAKEEFLSFASLKPVPN